MNPYIVVEDLFSFVFLWNSNTEVCDFLKGETAEEICGIDWRRATWNGVDWPRMAVHNQPQMKEMKRKRSLLDVLNHFTLQPAKGLDGVRDRTQCQVEMCYQEHTWPQTSWKVYTWEAYTVSKTVQWRKVCTPHVSAVKMGHQSLVWWHAV